MDKGLHITTRRDLRIFGLIMGGMIALLFGFLFPWKLRHQVPFWPWYLSVIFIAFAVFYPKGLIWPYRWWMALGHILGLINTRIILGLVFYLLFFPIGLIMRFLGIDPMSRKKDTIAKSYRILSQTQPKEHMRRPF